MSFQDRDYYQVKSSGSYDGGGYHRMGGVGFPSLTPMVKYLLIANVAVFLLQLVFRNPEKYQGVYAGDLEYYFSMSTLVKAHYFQVWRLITFQFLHSVEDPFHLLFNMIGLYFLGTILERTWGGRRLLTFYLTCGAMGGLVFLIASVFGWMNGYLVGASGGVLGLLVACAILFPQIRVILFIFPVAIRTAAILFTVVYLLFVLTGGHNAGGHLCHLGGMATAFVWVMGRSFFSRSVAGVYEKVNRSHRLQQQQKNQQVQYEVDRILAKVHREGIQSLTPRERKILQEATEQQKRGN